MLTTKPISEISAGMRTETTFLSNSLLSHPARVCRTPRIHLGGIDTMAISFQCGGEAYYQFGKRLAEYHEDEDSTSWGRREFSIPPNKSVLFMGKSHTRQLVEALLCQYEDRVVDGTLKDQNHNIGFARFGNNGTVHWLTNNWIVFSSNWTTEVLHELPHPPRRLADFDVIVLGDFNRIIPGSNYYSDMVAKSQLHASMNVSLDPPDLLVVRKTHPTAILVAVSSFAQSSGGVRQFRMQAGAAQAIVLDGRQHVGRLGECGAKNQNTVDLCLEGDNGAESHRCSGPYGGIADVTAWDLIETLHSSVR